MKQNDRRPYTSAEIKKAFELQAQGLDLHAVAERLGRSHNSLCSTMSNHRRAPKKFTLEEFAKRRERMVFLFEAGVTLTEIAVIYGTSITVVSGLLDRSGLDAEARQEIRTTMANA